MDEHTNETGQGRRADHAPEPYTPEPGAIITLAGEVPAEGWQCRGIAADGEWFRGSGPYDSCSIVEARPIPKPPLMVAMDRDLAMRVVAAGWGPSVGIPLADAIRAALAAESES